VGECEWVSGEGEGGSEWVRVDEWEWVCESGYVGEIGRVDESGCVRVHEWACE
jgi:hypothetical protein